MGVVLTVASLTGHSASHALVIAEYCVTAIVMRLSWPGSSIATSYQRSQLGTIDPTAQHCNRLKACSLPRWSHPSLSNLAQPD